MYMPPNIFVGSKRAIPVPPQKDLRRRSLVRWNLGLAALFALLGLVAAIKTYPHTQPFFFLTVTGSKPFYNANTTLTATPTSTTYDVGYANMAMIFFTGVAHLLYATVLEPRLNAMIQKGYNVFRWIEYSISAPIMLLNIAVLNGIWDIQVVFPLVGGMHLVQYFGLAGELLGNTWATKLLMIPPWLFTTGAFASICIQLIHAADTNTIPAFVWALDIVLYLCFASFGIVFYYASQHDVLPRYRTETYYSICSLVAKMLLLLIPSTATMMR